MANTKKGAKKPADQGSDLAALRSEADAATERAGEAMAAYGETKAGVTETVGDAATSAVAAKEEARIAQAQVDRLEQHTRAQDVAAEDLPGNRPSGVVGDAWGGPAAERERVADLKEKAED